MRRLPLFLLIISACVSGQEPVSDDEAPPTTAQSTQPSSSTPELTSSTARETTTTTAVATTTTTIAPLQRLAYEPVASVPFPVQMTASPGASIAYVVSKEGTVWALVGDGVSDEPVLDISDSVRNRGEQGLLAMALHPDDPSRIFLHYSGVSGETVVAEFSLTTPTEADRDSETVLLTLTQPASNHNGGMLQFAPDGALMVALGDGGGANDRYENAQDTSTLLGGLVRVDVDTGSAELFNHGLRNPWRFWIDGESIYIADVGQDAYEEVNVAPFGPGLNFGWPIMEGLHCFSPSSGCDTTGLVLPVVEVSQQDAGTCSITGGIVYRGTQIPEVNGHYFYSDYCGGYLRSFLFDGGEIVEQMDWTEEVGVPGRVTGFGVDGDGEMYVTTETEVFRVVAER